MFEVIFRGVVLVAILFFSIIDGAAQQRPYNIDDHLALEAIGAGTAKAERIIWQQAPPYNEVGYYGHDHTGAWGYTGFMLKTLDLSDREVRALSLFKPEVGVSYWIDSISPDGRYIAFYAAKDAAVFMGVYDTEHRRIRTFSIAPRLHWSKGRKSIWVSTEEFVFSAIESGTQPLIAARPLTTKKLLAESEKSWAGGVAVSVATSGLNGDVLVDVPKWKGGRLYKANARNGKLTLLAQGLFESLKISSDGRYLAGLRQAELSPAPYDKSNADWVRSTSQLNVFDLNAGGEPRVFAPNKNIFVETLAWAPNRNQLAFYAWDHGAGVQSGFYHALEADTGSIISYSHNGLDLASERERGFAQKPERVMWVDGRLAVFARAHDGDEALLTYRGSSVPGRPDYPGKADWFLLDATGVSENLTENFEMISPIPIHADTNSITVLADGDAWRIGPGQVPQNLTEAVKGELVYPLSVSTSQVHQPFQSEVVLIRRDGEDPSFVLIDLQTDNVSEVTSPSSEAVFIAGSVEKSAVLYRYDHDGGADLVLKYADGRKVIVDRINSHLNEVAKTEWKTIKYKVHTQDGERELASCVLLPPGHDPGKRYPVITEIYPSRGANCESAHARPWIALGRRPGPMSHHLLAAKGYIVFQPNTARAVIRTEAGPINALPRAVEQGLGALIEQGYADPDRIGLMGFSQGGFSSLYVATQSDQFKAIVSLNGWADMYSHYFDSSYLQMFYLDQFPFLGSALRYESVAGSVFGIGNGPFSNPDVYIRNSPLFNAPHVTAPIMLIHSDRDTFDVSQYERMFVALKLQNKKARLIRYWGEGHGPSSPGNIRHMWGEIFDWFDEYLGGPEPTEPPTQH